MLSFLFFFFDKDGSSATSYLHPKVPESHQHFKDWRWGVPDHESCNTVWMLFLENQSLCSVSMDRIRKRSAQLMETALVRGGGRLSPFVAAVAIAGNNNRRNYYKVLL